MLKIEVRNNLKMDIVNKENLLLLQHRLQVAPLLHLLLGRNLANIKIKFLFKIGKDRRIIIQVIKIQ